MEEFLKEKKKKIEPILALNWTYLTASGSEGGREFVFKDGSCYEGGSGIFIQLFRRDPYNEKGQKKIGGGERKQTKG